VARGAEGLRIVGWSAACGRDGVVGEDQVVRVDAGLDAAEPGFSVKFCKQPAARVSSDPACDRHFRPDAVRPPGEPAQPPTGAFSTEASKICPIEASNSAWHCSSVCWSDSPSSSAREKLAIMMGSLASNAHASSRL